MSEFPAEAPVKRNKGGRKSDPLPTGLSPFLRDFFWLIDQQGLSMTEIVRRAGYAHNSLSRWRRGDNGMSLQAAEDILAVLGFELTMKRKD